MFNVQFKIEWKCFNHFLANYFNINQNDKSFDDSYVRDFLENDGQRVLLASLNETRNKILFQNKIPDEYESILLFYKNTELNGNTASQKLPVLGMLTLEGGIVKSIYNSISSIFVPNSIKVRYIEII